MAIPVDVPEVPMLGIISAPLPMPPELFGLIGVIVVEWSRVEAGIVGDTATMMQWTVVRKLASEAPRNFNKKLELWRRAVRTLYPSITAYQNLANAFARQAKLAADARNHLMHGQWNLTPDAEGRFSVRNIRHIQGVVRCEEKLVSVETANSLLMEIETLSTAIYGFIATKMWHQHVGLFRVEAEPLPERQARQNPPILPKP